VSDLILHESVRLRSPRLVLALGGWPDAAQVATRAASLLHEGLGAIRFAEIRTDDFYDFSNARPTAVIRDGRIQALSYPENDFYYWRNPGAGSDLIVFVGTEPNLQWRRYVEAIIDLAEAQGVTELFALGGLYDNVPHTRPPRLSSVCESVALRERLAANDVVFSDYEGPSSLHTALLAACRGRRLSAASLWGHAPSYAQLSWNPTVTVALLEKLGRLLDVRIDLDEVRGAAAYLGKALDQLAARDPQVSEMLEKLEESYGPEETLRPSEPPAVSEKILREVEEILRQHENGEADDDPS
jgi:proteasome assembly chaperone (PAC2) family protein